MQNKEFISKIKSLKNNIIVDDSFFDSNKKKFLNYVSSEFNSVNKEVSVSNGFVSFINKIRVPSFAIGASTFAFVMFGFTVSASLKSLPGDPLYSFKISMENARVAMAFDDERSVNLQVEFAGNRIDELSMVLKSDKINKNKIAIDLVNKIDSDLSAVPNRVIALNNDKKAQEATAKVFDDKINEYSVKLKNAKNIASNVGVKDLDEELDQAYINGNKVAVKTLNIVVQNIVLSNNVNNGNNVLAKDIIDRVEKKVDNIKDVVLSSENTVVNNDNNDIINKPTSIQSIDVEQENKNTNTNQNGGSSSLIEQLQDMKQELQKAKIGLASADMASIINNVDKGLNNAKISTTPLMSPIPKPGDAPSTIIDSNNINNKNSDGSVQIQFESGSGYGLNHEDDFSIESLWMNEVGE